MILVISWLNKQITDNNLASSGKLVSYESGNVGAGTNSALGSGAGMFKPFGALTLNNMTTPSMSNTNEIDSMLHSNGYGGALRSTALHSSNMSQNHFMNKTNQTNEIESRRMLTNPSQMQMYSTSTTNYQQQQQQRALSSSSGSSIQNAETVKENHEM